MQVDRRTFTELLAAMGLVTASPALAQGKTIEVSMKNTPQAVFDPASITIGLGDTVQWTNPGAITHTVTCDPTQASKAADVAVPAGAAPFDSGDLDQDGVFKHTFTAKGTYKYVCKYHEEMGMAGTIIVS